MSSDERVRATNGSVVYPQVARAIERLGRDIALARRSRNISNEDFARRMGVSSKTLYRLENGDPGISINTLSMALHVLGRLDLLAGLVEISKDEVGLMAARQRVPSRARRPRRESAATTMKSPSSPEGPPVEPEADGDGYVGW